MNTTELRAKLMERKDVRRVEITLKGHVNILLAKPNPSGHKVPYWARFAGSVPDAISKVLGVR